MYISAQTSLNMKDVIVWERTQKGRVMKTYPAPWYFYVQDREGDYKDIHGNSLRRLDFKNFTEFKNTRDKYKNFGEKVYESDIAVDQKILSEHYYGKETTVDSHISFFDIEVDYDREQGFSSPQNPYAPVSAISLFHFWSQKSYMLLLSPHLSKWEPGPEWNLDMLSDETKALADIQFFDDEESLLLAFFELIEDTDIIAGWNSEGFDVPYVYERCLRLFGDSAKKLWCFEGAKEPRYKEVEGKFGQIDQVLEIFGREHVDYLKAFQKFEMAMRPSYSLEAISEEILPELPKLDYEGTLYSLYREDFEQFVRYGIRDSECLDGFEKKLGYIRLAVQMTHGSTTALKNVLGTLKVVECAIVNFCHQELHTIVPDSVKTVDDLGKFTGAAVLKPRVGMHEAVAALDVNSLYPSAIRTVNISPETIVGQFFENHKAYEEIYAKSSTELYFRSEDGTVETATGAEWYDYFRENNLTISGYGTVFNQETRGFLPTILSNWFTQRKKYQAEAKSLKAAMLKMEPKSSEYTATKVKQEYYDRLQYVYKILLNSAYGALGNQYFKFFDIRLAESTTRSGRAILMHMIAYIAKIMDGVYSPPAEGVDEKGKQIFIPTSECTVYGDTDSCYFKTYSDSVEEAKEVCEIVEKKTNDSFAAFCKEAFNSDHNEIKAGLDLISGRSIFIKPKMYIMHLWHADGHDVDKMKVMGLQIKKTNIPKVIGRKLTKFIESLLKGGNWRSIQEDIVEYKEKIRSSENILDIGLPKGIKGIEDYTARRTAEEDGLKIPGHVSASIFYNLCLDNYGDKESLRIVSGSKIKIFYLTQKFGKFKSIAIPTDMKKMPPWFEEHFMPLIDRDAQALRLIDKPLSNILGAIGERIPTRKSLLFDSLVEY
ncbi:DNA polymerase [Xanthomonas phage Xoo-sp13]|nr:DNA polymerase [Xanthomonas phage Xoo-sp13]